MGPIERELREWTEPHLPFLGHVSNESWMVMFGAWQSLGFGRYECCLPQHVPDVMSEAIEAAAELGI